MQLINRKENFIRWLKHSNLTNCTIDTIILCYEAVSKYIIKHCISKKEIWDINDSTTYNQIRSKLSANHIWRLLHRANFLLFEKTGKLYSQYLNEITAVSANDHTNGEPNIEVSSIPKSLQAIVTEEAIPSLLESNPIIKQVHADIVENLPDSQPNSVNIDNHQTDTTQEIVDFSRNDYFYHKKFGFGTIKARTDNFIEVKFDDYSEVKRMKADHPSCYFISRTDYEGKRRPDEEQIYETTVTSLITKSINIKETSKSGSLTSDTNQSPEFLLPLADSEACFSVISTDSFLNIDKTQSEVTQTSIDTTQNLYFYHKKFGFGVIKAKTYNYVDVKFDDYTEAKRMNADHPSCYFISRTDYEGKKKPDVDPLSLQAVTKPKRLIWDKFEVALLVEAFWKIENKEEDRQIVLTKLSESLRKKAIKQGMTIDETYRNLNGMSIQLANIALSFFPNRSAMHRTAIFDEIANLYKFNRNEFDSILEEAHLLVGDLGEKNANKYPKIDFEKDTDFSFSRPISAQYFDEKEEGFESWTDCYKFVMQHLYEDYPDIYLSLAGDPECTAFTKKERMLRRAVEIGDGIYAEGNKSASALVKHIKLMLNKCNVDFENLVIEYEKKPSAQTTIRSEKAPTYSVEIKETDFYTFIKESYQENHKDDGKIYKAPGHAQKCVELIRELNELLSVDIYTVKSISELQNFYPLLPGLNLDDTRYKWFVYVLKRYQQFISTKEETKTDNRKEKIKSEKELDISDYLAVIRSIFPDGYAFNNPLRKRKFKTEYSEINQKEFSDSDAVYLKKINLVGFISEEKVYLADTITEQVKEDIKRYIDSNFDRGELVIYYSAIYRLFTDKLNSSFSEDMFKHYLQFEFRDLYYFDDSFVSKKGEDVDLKQVLINIFMNCGCPLDIDEIYKKMPNVSHEAVDALIRDRDFVVNYRGKSYFYKDVFVIEDGELEIIKQFIDKTIKEKESVSGGEIYDFIEAKLPYVIESNPGITDLGYKNVLKLRLSNEFNFKGDVISAIGEELDVRTLFTNFCKIRENFSFWELEDFRNGINKNYIDWEGVLQNSVRISKNNFVRRDLFDFDIERIDDAIASYCLNEYISFKDIINFTEFPTMEFAWNNYILESYLFVNSKKFKLIHAAFNSDEPVGGIVKVISKIDTFDDLIIRIIRDKKLFERDIVFDYLLENDFIKRRKIKDIDLLIEKARKEG